MFVSVKGAELFYSIRGKGPVCFVLTSIGTKPYEFQMPLSLSENLTMVFVAPRGSGESSGNAADLTFDVLTDDLEAIRHALETDRVSILGHSILGALAIEYARRCPENVSHVVAVGTPPKGDMAWLMAESTAYFEKNASEERKQVLQDNLSKLRGSMDPTQAMLAQTPLRFFDPRFDAGPLFANAVINPVFFSQLLGPLTSGWDISADIESIRTPIFLAQGRHDYVAPYVLWNDILHRCSDATMQIFERSGHQPFFEEPDRFTESIVAWMRSRQ